MNAWLGIDPGLTGALALLNADGELRLVDMPTLKVGKRAALNVSAVVHELAGWVSTERVLLGAIERQQAMPRQGVASTFRTGYGYGCLYACLVALHCPLVLPRPQEWQRTLGHPGGKDGSRALATELLPGHGHLWTRRSQHGRAEAALLAVYARGRQG